MTEIIFLAEEARESGFTAKALNFPIFTEADTYEELKNMINDAIHCHFEASDMPAFVRIHLVREDILPLSA